MLPGRGHVTGSGLTWSGYCVTFAENPAPRGPENPSARPHLQKYQFLPHSDAIFGIPSLWEALWCHQNASISLPSRNTRGALHYRWSGISEFSLHLVYVHIFDFLQHRYFHHGGTLRRNIDLRDSCVCCCRAHASAFPRFPSSALNYLPPSDPLISRH